MNPIIDFLLKNTLLSQNDIAHLGQDDTDRRILESWKYLLKGYGYTPSDIIKGQFQYTRRTDIPVIIRDIEYYSLCEHHLLPFFGTIDIAYTCNENGHIGVSKLPRLVDIFSRRLQSQEKLTRQIAEGLFEYSAGVAVASQAQHLCMTMRGVKASHKTNYKCFYFKGNLDTPEFRRDFINEK